MRKKIFTLFFFIMTIGMTGLFCSGIYGFSFATVKAKEAQEEVERVLREKQAKEEAEQQQRLAEMAAKKKARDEAMAKARADAYAWKGYKDASEIAVTGVGDSVMLAASDALYAEFPNGYFDAVFGRVSGESLVSLQNLSAGGKLGDVVVLSVITNDPITPDMIESFIQSCGDRPVFFITAYGIPMDSTLTMESVASQHKNVYVVDWRSYASGHPEWIMSDGLHPNKTGSQYYAQLLHDEIQKDLFPTPDQIEKIVQDQYGSEE